MEIIIFILILSVLVFIHELGHYIFAKRNGIRVKEFGLGYPPRLIELFKFQGTIFSLNIFPLGGFVQLEGEDGPEDLISKKDKEKKYIFGKPFYLAKTSSKLITVLAGIIFNILFAVLVFTIIFSRTGIPKPYLNQVRIAEVMPGSPAAEAGLETNSRIFAVNIDGQWQEIKKIVEIQDLVAAKLGQKIVLRTSNQCVDYECSDAAIFEKEIYLRTEAETPSDQGSMGVVFKEYDYQKYPWYQMPFYAALYGLRQAFELAILIILALASLVRDLAQGKSVADQVAGPVGIVHQASVYGFFDGGFWSILNFAALLSVNLAVMNLLPIPALDGGRAVLIILERLFPKAKIKEFSYYANYIGFIILILLMVVISFNDLWQIFQPKFN